MQRLLPMMLTLGLVAGLAPVSPAVVPGDVAPDFTLEDLRGASVTLSGFAGQAVLLAFVGYG